MNLFRWQLDNPPANVSRRDLYKGEATPGWLTEQSIRIQGNRRQREAAKRARKRERKARMDRPLVALRAFPVKFFSARVSA